MKAIVGLGNPGAKYTGTRHNVGFAVVDEMARRGGVAFEAAPAEALIARWRRPDAAVLLVEAADVHERQRPGGRRAGALFQDRRRRLLVVVDEVQLPLGRLRARARGSAGGHNGLKSVIAHLGDEFARLRLGVGRGDARRDLADHVLSRFDKDEAAEVERMIARAADAAEMFITSGIEAVMNGFNGGDPATTE